MHVGATGFYQGQLTSAFNHEEVLIVLPEWFHAHTSYIIVILLGLNLNVIQLAIVHVHLYSYTWVFTIEGVKKYSNHPQTWNAKHKESVTKIKFH